MKHLGKGPGEGISCLCVDSIKPCAIRNDCPAPPLVTPVPHNHPHARCPNAGLRSQHPHPQRCCVGLFVFALSCCLFAPFPDAIAGDGHERDEGAVVPHATTRRVQRASSPVLGSGYRCTHRGCAHARARGAGAGVWTWHAHIQPCVWIHACATPCSPLPSVARRERAGVGM
jgi:hypothetical protein